MTVKKAVFVVAGFGTRFLPVTKTVPKEMLPIINKPTLQYAIEEAMEAGITDLIFVVSRNKKAIEDYLDGHPELEALLKNSGKEGLLTNLNKIADSARVFFVRQPGPLGTGDAVLRTEPIIGNEPFVVIYPDDLFLSDEPFTKQLIETYEQTGTSVIGLNEVPMERVSAYGVIKPGEVKGRDIEVTDFVEKPKIEDAPSNLVFNGRILLTPGIFQCLSEIAPASNGEYYIPDAVKRLMETEKVYGTVFKGRHFDTGNKIGYLKANVYEAFRDPEIRKELQPFIAELEQEADAASSPR